MTEASAPAGRYDVVLFFALACAITWLLDLQLVLAWFAGVPPAPHVVAFAGLGALGPTIAALVVAARRGALRGAFGRWRGGPGWILLALLTPAALHVIATAIEVALGGRPAQWFYPPVLPEHVAALVMFSVGEEVGWRGFAYPRLADRRGPVVAALIVGAVWGLWHLGMMFMPGVSAPELRVLGLYIVELGLYSVVMAWLYERSGRSLLVAIACHAGAHLDNVSRAPEGEVRLRVLRFVVLVVAAGVAGWALRRGPRAGGVMWAPGHGAGAGGVMRGPVE